MDKDLMNFEANFSVLDRYGTNVTEEEYVTDPAIGRDQQIKELILVLLTPEKSAILIGKPGIGKTAIVEGLAYRIQKNDVPDALKGYTIINIKTASLLGTMPSGESKVQKMIDELKTKEKMILFIDEVHMLIGSTDTSSLDFANIFKEGLGRGSIKVIGATTTEEYEKYILRDKAFTRRFQKIDVPEPSREETIKIMIGTLPKFEKQTGRKMKYTAFIQERIMSFIVDITSEYKRVFSLGSRYPDVCLTLLKQAFSYTVYDNRPYVDIFDVRKAIENSKNIYPDVIKKELPNFDKMFNDIMLEEKGEKPVEEWRKDNTQTRSELEKQANNQETEETDSDDGNEGLSLLDKVPDMVDKLEIRNSKPINNIISSRGKTKFAKVGSTAVSVGLKEKLNKTTNSTVLDDMILSSNIDVLKMTGPQEKEYTNFMVTDEIRPGVDDNFLLQRPIVSNTIIDEPVEEEQIVKYRGNQRRRNEGKRMWNNDFRPERQDISTQNFDKYQNFFHPENNINNQNNENENRMDLLMSGSNNYNPSGMPNNGPMYDPMNNGPMYDPMNNQMGPMNGPMGPGYGPMNNGPMYDPMSNQMGPMNGPMGPGYGPMNNGPMYDPMNNQMRPMNGPMGPGYGPMNNGPMFDPMNNQMGPMNGPMYDPMSNQMGSMNNGPAFDPMNNQPNSNNDFLNMPTNNDINNGASSEGAFFGNTSNKKSGSQVESLFGAPMYSGENTEPEIKSEPLNPYDNLLLADNMSLKNGEIVNEFPTFEKLNNLSNIATSTDQNSSNNQQSGQSGFNMMNNQPMPMNGNRNWTFINDNQNYPQQNMNMGMNMGFNMGMNPNMNPVMNQNQKQNNSSFFQKNILDDVKKNKEKNEQPSGNITSPTNNKDYYEDMKSGDFVNFSDLNKGKIKEEDTNKYMGVQVEENKPQFDLNLEGNTEEEDKFDDFYE